MHLKLISTPDLGESGERIKSVIFIFKLSPSLRGKEECRPSLCFWKLIFQSNWGLFLEQPVRDFITIFSEDLSQHSAVSKNTNAPKW